METALMHDIGWPSLCGNSTVDPGEDCDNGSADSDTMPDACRTDCSRASCGDGVKDSGEACDLGLENGAGGSTCSSTCMTVIATHPDAGTSLGGNGGGLGGATGGGAGGAGIPENSGRSGCACSLEAGARASSADLLLGALAALAGLGLMGGRRRGRGWGRLSGGAG
jgi:hypothetical protein